MSLPFFTTRIIVILAFLVSSSIQSQSRIAINGIDVINKSGGSFFSSMNSSNQVYSSVPSYCVDFFANHKKFITIDRKNQTLISKEKELQKSEDFIDGYMVEQGKSEGVDYILKSIYYQDKKTLSIRIYDIKEGIVKCSKERNLESNLFGLKNLEKQVRYLLHELMWECFAFKFTVMRTIDPNDQKAKKLLVAMGSKSKIEVEDEIEIFEMTEEMVDDEKIARKKILGHGEIKVIQDANFCEVETKSGNKEIASAMASGKKLFCTVINKYFK